VFTRSIQMQNWINLLIEDVYGRHFPPINGSISDRKQNGQKMTYDILQKFNEHPGTAALVLSPEVAGVGLNITCANHVIHYGRWWNPAKEDQATCRAYRKGQLKPVFLYVPVGKAPVSVNTTSFDERLDRMLQRKNDQRHNFLYPSALISDDDLSELFPGLDWVTPQAEGYQFEQDVADWMEAQGYEQVIVTAKSGDFGADVLGIKGECFYLVQCKRTLTFTPEIVSALQAAQLHYGPRHPSKQMVPVVVSANMIDERTRQNYLIQGIEVWGIK
jgi:Helicase conserved C-terminal domain/Restriction endonuclease